MPHVTSQEADFPKEESVIEVKDIFTFSLETHIAKEIWQRDFFTDGAFQ